MLYLLLMFSTPQNRRRRTEVAGRAGDIPRVIPTGLDVVTACWIYAANHFVIVIWQFRVATRPSSLRIHRRKAVGGILTPGSGHSSQAVGDPQEQFRFSAAKAAKQRIQPSIAPKTGPSDRQITGADQSSRLILWIVDSVVTAEFCTNYGCTINAPAGKIQY